MEISDSMSPYAWFLKFVLYLVWFGVGSWILLKNMNIKAVIRNKYKLEIISD